MTVTQNISNLKTTWELNAHRFISLRYTYSFSQLLMVDPRRLNLHINKPIYFTFEIPKRKSGVRKIQAPNDDLKSIQKRLNYFLQAVYLKVKPNCVHGFVCKPGYLVLPFNIVSNASVHINTKHLLNLDVQDFFPSISAKRVKDTLMSEPFCFNDEISTLIALLGSYQKKLPTGSPCSPILANIVCYEMDIELEKFCSGNCINFTRYADDLSFSGNSYFSTEIIEQIKSIINKHQFTLNEKKIRLQSSKSKQTVTGIVVNKKANVDRKYIRNLRAILHDWKNNGLDKAAARHLHIVVTDVFVLEKFLLKIKGQIDFVGQVRGKADGIFNKLKVNYYNLILLTK